MRCSPEGAWVLYLSKVHDGAARSARARGCRGVLRTANVPERSPTAGPPHRFPRPYGLLIVPDHSPTAGPLWTPASPFPAPGPPGPGPRVGETNPIPETECRVMGKGNIHQNSPSLSAGSSRRKRERACGRYTSSVTFGDSFPSRGSLGLGLVQIRMFEFTFVRVKVFPRPTPGRMGGRESRGSGGNIAVPPDPLARAERACASRTFLRYPFPTQLASTRKKERACGRYTSSVTCAASATSIVVFGTAVPNPRFGCHSPGR